MFNFDPNDPRQLGLMMAAAQMLSPGPGGVAGALSRAVPSGLMAYQGVQGSNDRRKQEAQERQLREMAMEREKRGLMEQEQIRSLAGQAFAQPQMVPNDPYQEHQTPGGGGMPEFARGLMGIDPLKAVALQQQIAQANKPDLTTVAPGATVYDRRAQKPVFQAPEKTPDWLDPRYIEAQSKIRAAGRPQVTTNVMPPREIFKDSMALKKDFDGQPEVKGFKEVQAAWDQISTALKTPSAANDLAAATKYMKMLDPGSVVRESELNMAMQASGAFDRMANYHKRLLRGEKLTPQQRLDFHSAGEALYNAAKGRYGETVTQYDGIAKQYGLDTQFIPRDKPQAPKQTMKIGGKEVEVQTKDGKKYVQVGSRWFEVQD